MLQYIFAIAFFAAFAAVHAEPLCRFATHKDCVGSYVEYDSSPHPVNMIGPGQKNESRPPGSLPQYPNVFHNNDRHSARIASFDCNNDQIPDLIVGHYKPGFSFDIQRNPRAIYSKGLRYFQGKAPIPGSSSSSSSLFDQYQFEEKKGDANPFNSIDLMQCDKTDWFGTGRSCVDSGQSQECTCQRVTGDAMSVTTGDFDGDVSHS
jgi:hypothetical protein